MDDHGVLQHHLYLIIFQKKNKHDLSVMRVQTRQTEAVAGMVSVSNFVSTYQENIRQSVVPPTQLSIQILNYYVQPSAGIDVGYSTLELQPTNVYSQRIWNGHVHGVLKKAEILKHALSGTAQEASEALVRAAMAEHVRDNATAVIIRVKGLAASRLHDAQRRGRQLPVPPKLMPGERLDGLLVQSCVFSNGVHRVYKVRDEGRATWMALKTLHESRASDPEARAMLAHEA